MKSSKTAWVLKFTKDKNNPKLVLGFWVYLLSFRVGVGEQLRTKLHR